MPFRDSLFAADTVQTDNGIRRSYVAQKVLGEYQYISAFNNAGTFLAGRFRANNVKIHKISSYSVPCSGQEDKHGANVGTFSGHAAALLASNAQRGPLSSYWITKSAWDQGIAQFALQKAYGKTTQAQFDLGVVLGEAKETFLGFARPLSAIRKQFNLYNNISKHVKQKRLPGLSDNLDMLSGTWLEWWYGIYPAIKTIDDLIKHVQEQALLVDGKMLRKRGMSEVSDQYELQAVTYPGSYQIKGSIETTVTQQYTAAVYYKLKKPLTIGKIYGLDVPSWPGIAWELLTLSFVWDWFFGVGVWLSSLKSSDSLEYLGSSTSCKTTIESKVPNCQIFYNGIVPSSAKGSAYSLSFEQLERKVNLPLSVLPVVNPAGLSLQKTITAISLAWQKLPRIKRK